ncbi:PepSY-associated TM helix domain-containing protein [Paraburkholderia sp.]|uniref:PepSY-associated TM helix domain-containing protein n=1 Tax=Paraburkholderia sp. TaxID=1926495 RepID=UPI00239937DB|nr:PepSY-associated TM helix domain-containing protein [Paraburkholderia sp.]MDE1180088.1 PepSY-associated TM helix domain-containing protein [Paraburkholderia sp.]
MRKYLYWTHLWIGLVLGIYFAFMGLTGSALVFKTEIHEVLTPSLYRVDVPRIPAYVPLDTLIGVFRSTHPGVSTFSIRLPLKPDASTVFSYVPVNPPGWRGPVINPYSPVSPPVVQGRHDRHEWFIDPYSARVLGEQLVGGTFFYVLHNLHAHLLLEGIGYTFHTYGVLFLLTLVISGLWLWWPSLKNFGKQFKARTRIKFGASIKRIMVDLHNVAGFYALVVLLAIVTTASLHFWPTQAAAIISQAVKLLSESNANANVDASDVFPNNACASQIPALRLATYQEIARNAANAESSLSILELDISQANPVVLMGSRNPHMVAPLLTSVTVNGCSGRVEKVLTPQESPVDIRATNWIMFVHFGQWGPGFAYYLVRAIWFLTGICPTILFLSGVLMYLAKRKAKQEGQRRRAFGLAR